MKKFTIDFSKFLYAFCIVIVLLAFPILLNAQPTDPTPASAVPIDGGVGFLLAAGAAFGIKKLGFRKK